MVLLLLLLGSMDWQHLAYVCKRIRWWLALPIIVAVSATNFWAAWAWQLLLYHFTRRLLPLREAIRLYFIGQAFGSVTPMNVGNDLYRLRATGAFGGRMGAEVAAIVMQRLTSAQALLVLGGLAACVAPLSPDIKSTLFISVAALLALSILILWLASMGKAWLLSKIGLSHIPGTRLWKAAGLGITLAFALHLNGVVVAAFLVSAAGIPIPYVPAIAALMLARLAILLPFTVNGLGVTEGALAFFFLQFGATAESGAILGLLLRLQGLLTAATGAVLLWKKGGSSPLRTAHSRPNSETGNS
ncbi:MAG: lysylphosphatidylglycerol synthase transmembrane domain-containing protein [Thermoanaerobaculaceae bacterium]